MSLTNKLAVKRISIGTNVNMFTVPAGKRWTVLDIVARGDLQAAGGKLALYESSAGARYFTQLAADAVGAVHWVGRQTFDPGEVLTILATGDSFWCTISGWEFLI